MKSKKTDWKLPAIILLALLLILEMADIYRLARSGDTQPLPVLMYHHFADVSTDGTVVTPGRFREQMTALREGGYEAVTVPQVIAFVREGTPLPDKPVLITMDDGYGSNLTVAAPILEETGMRATIFTIGINEGEEYYAHSGEPMWQHRFAFEEAAPWVEKGIIDVQSHTFDMHQLESYGYSGRDGVRRMRGESPEDYRRALLGDAEAFRERRGDRVATELLALAYPFGYYDLEADKIMEEAGYQLTVTIDERINRLRAGDEECLRMLGRFNVTDHTSGEALVDRLDHYFPDLAESKK